MRAINLNTFVFFISPSNFHYKQIIGLLLLFKSEDFFLEAICI